VSTRPRGEDVSVPERGRARLSGVVITRDEADRIADCLASLAFCDDLVVLDSGSTDDTRAIAAAAGARVCEHAFDSFGPQKNRAVALAAHDWVLCIDADERVGARLRDEMIALRDAGFPGCAGWTAPRLSRYLGVWIRHGTWYPDRQLKLYDRRRGRWAGDAPHERVHLDADAGPPGALKGDLEHHPYRSLEEHLRTIDRYTTTMARGLHARGRRASGWDLVLHPAARFLRSYVLKRGFLLGWRGLLLACLAAHYVQVKYAKLLVLQRADVERPPPGE
jgi:glycosyltransferase involved in cell wall biosynthesis